MITVEILSDPVCPWCYIGWTNLARAMEAAPNHPLAVSWHPFMLNPDMPKGGMGRRAYLEAKFGPEGAAAYAPQIEAAAREAGLAIDLGAIARTPSTLDAHRLIHWAGIEGRQTAVAVRLFRAYFREGRDIGDRETLADLGAEAGMDGPALRRLLSSEADAAEVRAAAAQARERGASGVPTFIVAKRHAVTGAQPVETWARVIAELGGRAEA